MHPDPDRTAAPALDAVVHALAIEPTRVVGDAPNGFTWWLAPGLRQHVRVEAGAPGRPAWLRLETPVWRGADPTAVAPLVAELGRHARGTAVRHAPGSGELTLVTRAPLPDGCVAERAAALAGTGAIQAFLAAWAWGEAATSLGPRSRSWRDALPHPTHGFDTPPDPVFGYRERVLRPLAAEREGAFATALLHATVDALESAGVGLLAHRRDDGLKTTFLVDLGPIVGRLEVGVLGGPVDARSLVTALVVDGQLDEGRAWACAAELLRRQLAPGSDVWTMGSWMPMPRFDDRPGLGVTQGLFVPLALASADLGPELATAAAGTVGLVRTWLAEGAPARVITEAVPAGARLVA